MSFDLEKEIYELEGVRVAFCNPAKVNPERSYKETYSVPLDDTAILDEIAARIVAVVGEGHGFVIVFGDGGIVKYSNAKNTVVPFNKRTD